MDYLTTHTSLSPIWRRFAPRFVNYKKGALDSHSHVIKVYQLLAHGRWFSPGTPASSTTKFSRHDIAEILLKVVLNTKNQIKSIVVLYLFHYILLFYLFVVSIICIVYLCLFSIFLCSFRHLPSSQCSSSSYQ